MKFDELVFNLVKKIPTGKVTTYKEIARKLGKENSSRLIGKILNKNPKPIKIPCHRVVRSDGSIGGYKLGKRKKVILLKKEGIRINKGKINGFREFFYRFK